jgi:hypothetical protein
MKTYINTKFYLGCNCAYLSSTAKTPQLRLILIII